MDLLSLEREPLTLGGEEDCLFEMPVYPKPFEFNSDVARVFDNMVSRSVPLYKEVNHCIVEWAYMNQREDSVICDLGCSTGTTLLAIGQQLKNPAKFIGIDRSEAMLERARVKLQQLPEMHSVSLRSQDLTSLALEPVTFAIMTYTLQFVPVARREKILRTIWESLKPGGIFFLSEKICSPVSEIQEAMTCSYEHFKRRAGYSLTEIERKKEALDQVLIPFTLDQQLQLLKNVGFAHCEPVIRWNQFVSIVAVKK